jgi:prophage DNA circulation protein
MADDLARTTAPFAFEGIEFPGTDITTSFGHDSAQHKGFGTRGADIETTGPKAEVIRVRAVLLNGLRGWRGAPLYPDTYQRLLRALKSTPNGLMTHPTRGVLDVHFDEGTEEIRPVERRGVVLTLSFTEQQGTAELLEMAGAQPEAGAQMLSAAAAADAVKPDELEALTADVEATLVFLEDASRTFGEAVTALDALSRGIEERLADPAAAAVEMHPFRDALWSVQTATLRYRERYTATTRTYTVPEAASVARIAASGDVYGDASRAADLMAANTVLDPTLVPAGTVLIVPD